MDKMIKNPAIRVEGHTEDWRQEELGKFLSERKEMQKISEDAPILAFASGQGVINRSERKSNNRDHLTLDQENKIYKLTEFNDIVYNPSNLKYGAIDRNKHGRGVISPIYITFTTEEEPSFIELIVKSEKFKLRALQYEEGTVVKRQSVNPENLLSLKVSVAPSKQEQQQIGSYFQYLDNLITLHQKKHDKLVILKKAMLAKMFPKNGALVPEIRFKGFTEDWEKETLKNISTTTIGEFVKRTKQNPNSLYPVFNGGKSFTGFYDDFNNEGNKLVISARGANAGFVNFIKVRYWAGNSCYSISLTNEDTFNIVFMYYVLKQNESKMIENQQAANIPSVSKSDVEKIEMILPKFKEQQKIGFYFQNLDHQIKLHKTQIDKLYNIKKACFSKMFVGQD